MSSNVRELIIDTLHEGRAGLIKSPDSTLGARLAPIVNGDGETLQIFPVKSTGNESSPWESIDWSGVDVVVSVGNPGQRPTGGEVTMFYGIQSVNMAYNLNPSTFQAALNALPAITSDGGVSVTGVAGEYYVVAWNSVGARATEMYGESEDLLPFGFVSVSVAQVGDASTKEIRVVSLSSKIYCFANSFSAIDPVAAVVSVIAAGSGSSHAVQKFGFSRKAIGGTFQITFDGETTVSLPFDASKAEVEAALTDCSVTGPDGGPWTIEKLADGAVAAGSITTTGIEALEGIEGDIRYATKQLLIEMEEADASSINRIFEIEITPSGGAPFTVFRSEVKIFKDVFDSGTLYELPQPDSFINALIDARAVRYDAIQLLTSAQKRQARENISANYEGAYLTTSRTATEDDFRKIITGNGHQFELPDFGAGSSGDFVIIGPCTVVLSEDYNYTSGDLPFDTGEDWVVAAGDWLEVFWDGADENYTLIPHENPAKVVHMTGTETIAGQKILTTPPRSTGVPTLNDQMINIEQMRGHVHPAIKLAPIITRETWAGGSTTSGDAGDAKWSHSAGVFGYAGDLTTGFSRRAYMTSTAVDNQNNYLVSPLTSASGQEGSSSLRGYFYTPIGGLTTNAFRFGWVEGASFASGTHYIYLSSDPDDGNTWRIKWFTTAGYGTYDTGVVVQDGNRTFSVALVGKVFNSTYLGGTALYRFIANTFNAGGIPIDNLDLLHDIGPGFLYNPRVCVEWQNRTAAAKTLYVGNMEIQAFDFKHLEWNRPNGAYQL